jgi:hypothetical protein
MHVAQDLEEMEETIRKVASSDFTGDDVDPNTRISFVMLKQSIDFVSFYDWYVDMEDNWLDDDVTLAPFHPDWSYESSDGVLELEKQAPYPTVSLVSTGVIDKAGPEATNQIAEQNADTLQQKTLEEWRSLYKKAIH